MTGVDEESSDRDDQPAPAAALVAAWMVEQMGDKPRLYQEAVARSIKTVWGEEWLYKNANGNPAISKAVLKEFRKLTTDTLVWERGDLAWRKRKPTDKGRSAE